MPEKKILAVKMYLIIRNCDMARTSRVVYPCIKKKIGHLERVACFL